MALRFVWPRGRSARAAPAAEVAPAAEANLLRAAQEDPQQLLARLNSSADGLSSLQAQLRLARLGPNQIARQQPVSWFRQLLSCTFTDTAMGDISLWI
jgi:Mg2+-importing ATPase